MRLVFAVVWLAALAASAWAAWRGWRVSRPGDVIRTHRPFGFEQTAPRWIVWSPTVVVALTGPLIAPTLADAPGPLLFMVIFWGGLVWLSASYALTLISGEGED